MTTPNNWSGMALAIFLLALSVVSPAQAQGDDNSFIIPYSSYTVTGGCHPDGWQVAGINASCAVDVASIDRDGAALLSPINGEVTATGPDDGLGLGNTYIIIENSRYAVFLLHGNYSVSVGTDLILGEQFGTEGANGNATGYHTHLTVYDKAAGEWVNPLSIASGSTISIQAEFNQRTDIGTSAGGGVPVTELPRSEIGSSSILGTVPMVNNSISEQENDYSTEQVEVNTNWAQVIYLVKNFFAQDFRRVLLVIMWTAYFGLVLLLTPHT